MSVDYILIPLVALGFYVTARIMHPLLGLVVLVAAAVFCFAYFIVKDGLIEGSSVGKYLAGLMVVNLKTDLPCSMRSSFLRAVPVLVPGVDLAECLLVVLNRKGRRIGDMIAKTMVIARVDYLAKRQGMG